MPLKRIPRAQRESPTARAQRAAVAEALDAMLARIPDLSPSKTRRIAKEAARFRRYYDAALAEWDAKPAAWQRTEGAYVLAETRRYDAAFVLPLDGGRGLFGVMIAGDRQRERAARKGRIR